MTSPHSLPTEREIELAKELGVNLHRLLDDRTSCGIHGPIVENLVANIESHAKMILSLYAKERSYEALDKAASIICPHKLGKMKIGTRHMFCCEHAQAILKLKESK